MRMFNLQATILFAAALMIGGRYSLAQTSRAADDGQRRTRGESFLGLKAGDEREVNGMKLC